MNEVKHIHLGQQQFTISLEAYGELKDYLDAITTQVGDMGDDMTQEVELRMAELLTERGYTADKAVLPKDVRYLKDQLGEPSAFKEDADLPVSKTAKEGADVPKRLFRDTEHSMVAGVAAGLANYFGIDAVIIRLLFVTLVLAGGSGIVLYVLLWLLVPEAKTTSDRLTMQGKAVTVGTLKAAVQQADIPGAARRVQSTVGSSLGIIGKIILIIAGSLLALASGAALIGTIATTTYFLLDGAKVAGSVIFPIGSHEVIAFIAAVGALVILLLTLMLVGIAMVRRRWQVPAWGVAALIGLFFVSASVGGALTADVVPTVHQRIQAMHHQSTLTLPDFTEATINAPNTELSFVPDQHFFVQYRYFGRFATSNITAKVSGQTLNIKTDGVSANDTCGPFCFSNGPDLEIIIHAPALQKVSVSGDQASFNVTLPFDQTGMSLEVAQGSLANVSGTHPNKITLLNDNFEMKHLTLAMQQNITKESSVGIDNYGMIYLSAVQELDLTTAQVCDNGNASVVIDGTVGKLIINNKKVTADAAQYTHLMNYDTANVYNCLNMTTDNL